MEQNLPLAIVLALIATFGFAGGAAIQHFAVGETVERREQKTMGGRALLRLVTKPRWLGGTAIIGVAGALHILALMLGPVTVVQPVGILAVPWSILIAAKIHKHEIPLRIWAWVTLTIAALGMFTILSSMYASTEVVIDEVWLPVAIVSVGVLAALLSLAGHRGRKSLRCLAWAAAGSVLFGLASALVRVLTDFIFARDWLGNWLFWVSAIALAAAYATGGWMIQQGYANGPAETVVGAMTSVDPVIAVIIGLTVLGEGGNLRPSIGAGMMLLGVTALVGIALLSHDHPDAVMQRRRLAAEDAETVALRRPLNGKPAATELTSPLPAAPASGTGEPPTVPLPAETTSAPRTSVQPTVPLGQSAEE